MSHDKISAAARERMAQTGEPYAAARRAVINEHQGATPPPGAQWFEIAYSRSFWGRISGWTDAAVFGAGLSVSGVEVDPTEIRVRMGSFKLDVPRSSIRSVTRSQAKVGGTIGVHESGRGRWLVNGSPDGLVEMTIEPPVYLPRGLDTLFRRAGVHSLTVSLVDPDAFIAALTP